MAKNEGNFRKDIIKYFIENECFGWPIENSVCIGMADILGAKDNSYFWVETKHCDTLNDKVKFRPFQPNWIRKTVEEGFEVWIAIKIGMGANAIFALVEGKNLHWVEDIKASEVVKNHRVYATNSLKNICIKMLKKNV